MKAIRALWLLLGFACFGLGALGSACLVLPTVPFLLAASFFFAKGSKRFHRWLCGTKLYQDHLEHFARTHEMTAQAKALLLGGVTPPRHPVLPVGLAVGPRGHPVGCVHQILVFAVPGQDSRAGRRRGGVDAAQSLVDFVLFSRV